MTLAPMGGDAPAAALVVAAAALPSSPHIGVRAARGIRSRALLAFAPCPPACPAGADGGAVGAQKAARPSRRVRCAPPVAACVRRSRAAAAVGRSAARSPLKRGLMWLVSPRSLPAAAPAPASVCAASSGGGACSPLRAAAPPPLLRPRPPLSVGGGGCGFHASAAAGAKKTAPCGAVLKETQYMVLALLDGGLLALPLGDAERAGQSAYAARRVQGVVVAKVQHRNILTQ